MNLHRLRKHFEIHVETYSTLFVNYGTLCYVILPKNHAKQNTDC
jgi:hypothetical protein